MATHTLSILKPSVNNLTVRIFVRAAGLDFEEVDVWGKKSTPEFLAKDPADLTPLLVSLKDRSPITSRRLNQILKKIFYAAAELLPEESEYKKDKLRA